jgi:hypothetical protein
MGLVKKNTKRLAIGTLTPNSFVVSIAGEQVKVASDKFENAIMNMFLASRLRHVLEEHLDQYKRDEKFMSPKELRDLAGAARDIAAFSAEVYAANEPLAPAQEKPVEQSTDVNFDILSDIKPNEPTGEDPKTDSSGPMPSV